MATATYPYEPDYTVPPGWVLEERLASHEVSHAEFARRCGRSPKLISEIIAGKAPIEPVTALQFEKVLGVDAGIWLGIESDYRLHLEREAEARKAEESVEWANGFPINELVKRGAIAEPSSRPDSVEKLLSFFGVASVDAWHAKHASPRVAYRHSPSFSSDERALATWLRLGELSAAKITCPDYDSSTFRRALTRTRELTALREETALSNARELCLKSGVVLAVVKSFPKTALSGATRWLTPRKALIQLSARHMSDDQLWYSFFHEAAHIMLHSKRDIFVDYASGEATEADEEANRWAADFLVPRRQWERFKDCSNLSKMDVIRFAEEQGIAPSIVVGRLQHEGLVPWNRLNQLKARLTWGD